MSVKIDPKILAVAIILFEGFVSVLSFNGVKLYKACRAEDGFHRCSITGICQERKNLRIDVACESDQIVCTNDEFACRGLNRCIPRSFVGTENGCLFGKKGIITLPCRDDEFTCRNSRICLPRYSVRDGTRNCDAKHVVDNSDELFSYEKCDQETEFQCKDENKRCIPREWVLDGNVDCDSRSDEDAPLPACNKLEYRCESGRCVLRYRIRDGFDDCNDGGDELQIFRECHNETEFRCEDSGRCIPRFWMADGISQCKDGSDENTRQIIISCKRGEFRCYHGRRCLPLKYLCDGINHCGDCSDEIEGCDEPHMWRCPGNSSICIPQAYGCDGFPDCPGGDDNPEYLPGFKCTKTVLGTFETQCVIPQWTLNDSYSACEDKSDICFLNGTLTCARCLSDNSIIAKRQVCNGVVDCKDLSDECLCITTDKDDAMHEFCESVCYASIPSKACHSCQPGQLYCGEGDGCVNLTDVCNGVTDCPNSRIDETACVTAEKATNLTSPETNFECWKLDDAFLQGLKFMNLMDSYHALHNLHAVKCDGVLECARFEDECDAGCSHPMEVCNRIDLIRISTIFGPLLVRACDDYRTDFTFDYTNFVLGQSICDGIHECPGKEDEVNCTGKFECEAGKVELPTGALKNRTSIDIKKVCDLKTDCLDQSDEINCSSSTHFYCSVGNPLFIAASKVMDGKQDCEDNSDECPPFAYDNNPFSSREEMISSPFLRNFIWIMALVAIIGNLGVILETAHVERRSPSAAMSRCNRVMILNLAISDIIMGVALVIIGSASSMMSGNYCLRDKTWRISATCNGIGVLVVLSSETSVFSLVVLTFYRLYGIFRPFESRDMKPTRAVMAAIMTWMLAFLLSILPVIPKVNQTMVTDVLTSPSNYFDNTVVSWSKFQTFAGRLFQLVPRYEAPTNIINTWNDIVRHLESNYADEAPKVFGYFGYYSAHGVCIPRLFRMEGSPPLHPLSLFVISVNFCSLLFIIVAYCLIYHRTANRKVVGSETSHENRARSMQKKITILVATDLCCWLPICIMTFASQGGSYMSGVGYAVAAIVLMPINSSLNPIIYSGGFAITRSAIFQKSSAAGLAIRRRRSKQTPDQTGNEGSGKMKTLSLSTSTER